VATAAKAGETGIAASNIMTITKIAAIRYNKELLLVFVFISHSP
jgi:hypothetical protein